MPTETSLRTEVAEIVKDDGSNSCDVSSEVGRIERTQLDRSDERALEVWSRGLRSPLRSLETRHRVQ
jgi:hypothetical protein